MILEKADRYTQQAHLTANHTSQTAKYFYGEGAHVGWALPVLSSPGRFDPEANSRWKGGKLEERLEQYSPQICLLDLKAMSASPVHLLLPSYPKAPLWRQEKVVSAWEGTMKVITKH